MKPLRGGKKKKNRAAIWKWQQNLERWIDGDWERVWEEACESEKKRRARSKRRKGRAVAISPQEAKMKKWTRIKKRRTLAILDRCRNQYEKEMQEKMRRQPTLLELGFRRVIPDDLEDITERDPD